MHTMFIRLSGWGLVLAGGLLLLSFLPETKPEDPAKIGNLVLIRSLFTSMRIMAFPLAIGLITLGLIGLQSRYGIQSGLAGNLGLVWGISSGAAALILFIRMLIDHDNGRVPVNISMAFMFGGLFVFGLAALRRKLLPRGNGLPSLAGFWRPAITIQAYMFPQAAEVLGPVVPFWLSFTLFCLMAFFLAWLGVELQANAQPGELTTQAGR